LGLSLITVVSWLLSRTDRSGGRLVSSTPITVAVLGIAFVKAMLILDEFMEVRGSPTWLRRFSAGWLIVLWATILAIYLA
jgi:hypothetical protein